MDKLKIEVLADGTIKSTTDEVSPENHQSAEAFLKYVADLTGGTTKRTPRGDVGHAHHHHDGQQHHTH